jgi:FkbH-like protein
MTDGARTIGSPAATTDKLRDRVESFLNAGQRDSAIQAARILVREEPGLGTWRFLRKMVARHGAQLTVYKVALLSSFSIEFVHDALMAYGFINGLKLELYQSGFGAFRQELLDPAGALYAWCPDAVILAVEGEDWMPAAYGASAQASGQDLSVVIDGFRDELLALIRSLRDRSSAPLLIHNFAPPAWRPLGILDANIASGQTGWVNRLNDVLGAIAQSTTGVHVVDYRGLTHRHGLLRWHDPRMRLYARAPIAQPMMAELAREYVKFLRCLVGFTKKCLVLDLDNTLWGGVVGEDGVDGIQLGPTYPGSAFLEFQQHLLALHRRGVILAVASKNNPADVEEVFARQQFMSLRREHFADLQVHWELKSESLRRIATNLGIGLEHMVFADDNPAECEQVRAALPMVTVIQLPSQPERYVQALHEDGWFDVLALSSEDLRRAELYKQRAEAEALRNSSVRLEDYYRALDMELGVAPVDQATLKRAAQLTQKTNQLNVTTRRYSEAQIATFMADPDWFAVTISIKDKFGDNGIVGVMLARAAIGTLEVDTFLLSCRVIGRAVETAMLAYLCDLAERRGLGTILGELIPTAKNIPVRDLFERHAFAKVSEHASGTSFWRLRVPEQRVRWPDWFRVKRMSMDPRESSSVGT